MLLTVSVFYTLGGVDDGVYMLRVLIVSSKVERRVVLLVKGVNCE